MEPKNTGPVRMQLALCLLVAWIVVFYSLIKGVKSSGKVRKHQSTIHIELYAFEFSVSWIIRQTFAVGYDIDVLRSRLARLHLRGVGGTVGLEVSRIPLTPSR